jgi:hypothetical protein
MPHEGLISSNFVSCGSEDYDSAVCRSLFRCDLVWRLSRAGDRYLIRRSQETSPSGGDTKNKSVMLNLFQHLACGKDCLSQALQTRAIGLYAMPKQGRRMRFSSFIFYAVRRPQSHATESETQPSGGDNTILKYSPLSLVS